MKLHAEPAQRCTWCVRPGPLGDSTGGRLKSGAAGSWALNHRSEAMLQGNYPLGFKLSLHHKDLAIALETANSVELDMPITALVEKLESKLIQKGYGNEDVSALHRWNTAMEET